MKFKILLSLVLALSFVIGCGGDDDDWWDDGSRKVNEVRINATSVKAGTLIHVDTYFETRYEWGYPEDAELVIKIDPELQYMPGSSELYIEGNSDRRSPDKVETCNDGTTFLWYTLDEDDDFDHYAGYENFNMRFDVTATTQASMARIQARAGKYVDYGCDYEFNFQEEDSVSIN